MFNLTAQPVIRIGYFGMFSLLIIVTAIKCSWRQKQNEMIARRDLVENNFLKFSRAYATVVSEYVETLPA